MVAIFEEENPVNGMQNLIPVSHGHQCARTFQWKKIVKKLFLSRRSSTVLLRVGTRNFLRVRNCYSATWRKGLPQLHIVISIGNRNFFSAVHRFLRNFTLQLQIRTSASDWRSDKRKVATQRTRTFKLGLPHFRNAQPDLDSDFLDPNPKIRK